MPVQSSVFVSFPCTVEIVSMHSFSIWALKVFHIVRSKNLVISKIVLSFALEEKPSSYCELLLQTYQSAHILMILSDVI